MKEYKKKAQRGKGSCTENFGLRQDVDEEEVIQEAIPKMFETMMSEVTKKLVGYEKAAGNPDFYLLSTPQV